MNDDPDQHRLFDLNDESEDVAAEDDLFDDELEDEEEINVYASLFGFVQYDKLVIDQLIDCVRSLLARPDATAYQIHNLAILLFALQRLPEPTTGVSIDLSVGRRYDNGESRHRVLALSDSEFRLENNAYIVLGYAAGGDSMSTTLFTVEVGGYREIQDPGEVAQWLEGFGEACCDLDETVDIDDYSTEMPDWFDEPDSDLWEKLDADADDGWTLF